jgi:hypothetical protein
VPKNGVRFFFSNGEKPLLSEYYDQEKLIEPIETTVEFWPDHVVQLTVDTLINIKSATHP